MIAFIVRGHPAPQGSKRHVGNGRMVESSKHVAPWREAVRHTATISYALTNPEGPIDAPIVVDMVFTFARPKSHYRTGRNAHLLRDAAPTHPTGPPDLSKLARSTEDALTDAGVWRDDALVWRYGELAKVYPGTHPDALDTPGAVIRVYPADLMETPDA